MEVDRTTQNDVLEAIVRRLRSQISPLSEQNCFLSETPLPAFKLAGDHIVTVSAGAGVFEGGMFAGAGAATLTERTNVLVTPLIRRQLDRPGEIAEAVLNEERGLLGKWKGLILRALLVEEVGSDRLIEWRPRAEGKEILRQALTPLNCTEPQAIEKTDQRSQTWVAITLAFEAMYDWRL